MLPGVVRFYKTSDPCSLIRLFYGPRRSLTNAHLALLLLCITRSLQKNGSHSGQDCTQNEGENGHRQD
jgi:hypothetical protein